MKFPRNAKIFRGHLDATPFAGVFFCLLIFVLLSSVVYTSALRINLPATTSTMFAVQGPAVAVGIGADGQFYFKNQPCTNLLTSLQEAVAREKAPVTLVVQADKLATQEQLNQVYDIAARAGIHQIYQAVLPRAFDSRVP